MLVMFFFPLFCKLSLKCKLSLAPLGRLQWIRLVSLLSTDRFRSFFRLPEQNDCVVMRLVRAHTAYQRYLWKNPAPILMAVKPHLYLFIVRCQNLSLRVQGKSSHVVFMWESLKEPVLAWFLKKKMLNPSRSDHLAARTDSRLKGHSS